MSKYTLCVPWLLPGLMPLPMVFGGYLIFFFRTRINDSMCNFIDGIWIHGWAKMVITLITEMFWEVLEMDSFRQLLVIHKRVPKCLESFLTLSAYSSVINVDHRAWVFIMANVFSTVLPCFTRAYAVLNPIPTRLGKKSQPDKIHSRHI